MAPNTGHLIYSDANSVAAGKHFYNAHMMDDTLAGYVHQFLASHVCTDSEHPEAIFYIFQMAWMWKVGYEDWGFLSAEKPTLNRSKQMAFGGSVQQLMQYILIRAQITLLMYRRSTG